VVEDRHQLHLDGIRVTAPDRLPIFSPSPASAPAVETTPPTSSPSITTAAPPRPRRSRTLLYAIIVAIALLAVASIAYFAGRSTRGPDIQTEQGR
jgi:hypothetical protein